MRRIIEAARRVARSIGGVFRGKGAVNERMGRDPNAPGNNRTGGGY